MIQQEVMELIQRSLDHDLSEEEHEKLMEMLRNDPESMELFERMKQLSQNLDNLPKVTPPYSIVDSIIPQLSQLEDESKERSESVRTLPSRKRSHLLWGWSSVVAAAVVVGVIIMNGGILQSPSEQAGLMEVSESAGSGSMSLFMADSSNDVNSEDLVENMSTAQSIHDAGGTLSQAPSMYDEVAISSKDANTNEAVGPQVRNIEEPEVGLLEVDVVHEEIIASPDERFTVFLQQRGDRFEVRIEDHLQNEVYVAEEIGYIEHFYWSDDSSQFIYTVSDGADRTTHEIEVE